MDQGLRQRQYHHPHRPYALLLSARAYDYRDLHGHPYSHFNAPGRGDMHLHGRCLRIREVLGSPGCAARLRVPS